MGALQLPDRRQHFLVGGKDGRPEACILQRLGAAHRIAEGGGGLVQAVHAEVLGHALEGVAGTEGQLPVLRVQRSPQLLKAGVAGGISEQIF